MKNLVLFAGIIVAVSFASCGGNKAEATEAAAEEVVETVEAVAAESCCQAADSCCGDSCCQAADSCCQAAAAE